PPVGEQLRLVWLHQEHTLLALADAVKVGPLAEIDGLEVEIVVERGLLPALRFRRHGGSSSCHPAPSDFRAATTHVLHISTVSASGAEAPNADADRRCRCRRARSRASFSGSPACDSGH